MLYKTAQSIFYSIQSVQGGPNHQNSMQKSNQPILTQRELASKSTVLINLSQTAQNDDLSIYITRFFHIVSVGIHIIYI